MREPENGNEEVVVVGKMEDIDEERMIRPGPAGRSRSKRLLQFEQAFLDSLPSAHMYEKSYMHRDVVTHVAVSAADFFITGSIDVMQVSVDGLLCCTISSDNSVKIYDVVNYDMMVMMSLPFVPGTIEWVYKPGDVKVQLAVSDRDETFIYMMHVLIRGILLLKSRYTMGPIKVMKYNHIFDVVISADDMGLIEYWCPTTLQFPENRVNFKFKSNTNLFEIAKPKTAVSAIEVSPDDKQFAITSPDRRVRVFWFKTGKLRRVYDELLEVAQELQRSDAPLYRLEAIDFGRRMAVEKEIEKTENVPQPNAIFY